MRAQVQYLINNIIRGNEKVKKIKISLEYGCFPIWIYDENFLIDNELSNVLINDKDIEL